MVSVLTPYAYLNDAAKRIVVLARRHAEDHRSDVVGPEHLLLALIGHQRGLASRVIERLGGNTAAVRALVTYRATPSPAHLAFTADTESALAAAAGTARRLGDTKISTGHLLLGLLTLDAHPAVRALGLDIQRVEAEVTGGA
jgi:ATP-dependent Clp protease ATP-binding subunit ClpA